MITFEYNGKIYKPSNLENKLKKLGVTINDVKIIDDTETKAEKLKKEKEEEIVNLSEKNLEIWWDTKAKGWYIRNLNYPEGSVSNFLKFWCDIEKERYRLIGYTNEAELSNFTKEHFKEVIHKKV